MPSHSLTRWAETRLPELDQIEHAHTQVGGSGPGRRSTTQQINYAYAVLLSSQFQGFCRDLHTETVGHLIGAVTPISVRNMLLAEFTLHRKLDTGNPTPGNIGADFNRLGLTFLPDVRARSKRSSSRMEHLESLNKWRNAIAHQDFDPATLGTDNLRLEDIRRWRGALNGLAETFDHVLKDYIVMMTGNTPW